MATIYTNGLSIYLTNELGQILQAELIHVLVSEVHDPLRIRRFKHLARQDWMPEKFSEDLRS